MRTIDGATRKKIEERLRVTGLAAVALGVLFGFADLQGWLAHGDRERFLDWVLHDDSGLPIGDPAAQAFLARFPPSEPTAIAHATHVIKFKTVLENGPVLDSAVRYLLQDGSRTPYVATLSDIREWAGESRYPWLSWLLTVVGFLEVLGSEYLRRQTEAAGRGA